jgi:hypothetical protein
MQPKRDFSPHYFYLLRVIQRANRIDGDLLEAIEATIVNSQLTLVTKCLVFTTLGLCCSTT